MNKPRQLHLRRASALAASVALACSTFAADIFKAANTDNLNLGSSWGGGAVPSATDIAVWDSTVLDANSVSLGANLTWQGIRIANPGGGVSLSANTLTLGRGGIAMGQATQSLSIGSNILVGPGIQQWNVANGQSLTVSGDLRKQSPTGANALGVVTISTTGEVFLAGTTSTAANPPGTISALSQPRLVDGQGNPYVTFGLNDWAATNESGRVIAASYTEAATFLTAGADNTVTGSFNINNTVDVASLRFASPSSISVNVSTSGTARTLTARGILVTADSGGGVIGGNAATSFIRPSRSAVAQTAFNVIQNSAADFEIAANISNGSSGAAVTVVKSGSGRLLVSHLSNGYTGGTEVFAGTLHVIGNTGSGYVNVSSGATLSGSGTIPGATTVNGTLDPTGTLTFSSSLTLGSASTTRLDVSSPGADRAAVTGSLALGGTLLINVTETPSTTSPYTLYTFGSAPTGSFSSVQLTGLFSGNLANSAGTWTGSSNGYNFTFSQVNGELMVIPEPAVYALIFGAIALAGAAARRRLRK
jgi:fibronectin-binding autotransporter adhesin